MKKVKRLKVPKKEIEEDKDDNEENKEIHVSSLFNNGRYTFVKAGVHLFENRRFQILRKFSGISCSLFLSEII